MADGRTSRAVHSVYAACTACGPLPGASCAAALAVVELLEPRRGRSEGLFRTLANEEELMVVHALLSAC